MSGSARWKSAVLSVSSAVAVLVVAAACASSQSQVSGGHSPGPSTMARPTGTASLGSVLSTSGFEAYEPRCIATLVGSKVEVTFAPQEVDSCGELTEQLESVVGGEWRDQDSAPANAATVMACVVDHRGESASVAEAGDAAGDVPNGAAAAGVCRRLLAAGWTEDKSMPLSPSLMTGPSASAS